jgi:hypothetical protein
MLKKSIYHDELLRLLGGVRVGGDPGTLEHYLMKNSTLPSPHANTALIRGFAYAAGELVTGGGAGLERLEGMIDGWAALSLDDAPVNDPREILVACAALTYGWVAVIRPDWWDDERVKLRALANDPRWRTREMVSLALTLMLDADWTRGYDTVMEWVVCEDEPLAIRAAAAAVAEPSLLTDDGRKSDALGVQAQAINQMMGLPPERRKDDDARSLRQALGFTLSVVTAALPEEGFSLMERLAALPDPDVIWIVRENIKHKRLSRWQDRLDTLETALFRPE